MLASVASDDGMRCVDVFEDPTGGFGFESFRADPEDGGRWTAVGGLGAGRYDTARSAVDSAVEGIDWLASSASARARLEGDIPNE